jgi:hypothetical protein
MGSEVILKHIRCDVRVPHLLHPEWATQHGGSRRTGNDTAGAVKVLSAKDDHRRVPDPIQGPP